MDVEGQGPVEHLVLQTVDHCAAEDEAGLLDQSRVYVFNGTRFVYVFDGLDEDGRILVAELLEEVQLEDVEIDCFAVLWAAHDEYVGVGGRQDYLGDVLLGEFEVDLGEVGDLGLELKDGSLLLVVGYSH